MEMKTLRAYKWLCELYGWSPSLRGLVWFDRQIKSGWRQI